MPWDTAQLVVRAADGTDARARRWAGRVGRPAASGARTSRCGSSATAPTSGRCTAGARTRRPSSCVDVGSDIAGPQWVFGQSRFALLADGRVVLAYGRDGADRLAVLRGRRRACASSTCPSRAFGTLTAPGDGGRLRRPAGAGERPVVLRVDVDGGAPEVLRPARDLGLDPAWFSRPEHVDVPDRGRRHRHRRGARAGLPADQPGGDRRRTASGRRCW